MTIVYKTIGDDDLILSDQTVVIDNLTYTGKGALVLTHPRVTAFLLHVHLNDGAQDPPVVRWEPTQPNGSAPDSPAGLDGWYGTDATCAPIGCGLHAGGGGGGGNDGTSQDGIVPPKSQAPYGFLQATRLPAGSTIDVIIWDGVPGHGVDGGKNGHGDNFGGPGGGGVDCGLSSLDAGIGGDGGDGGNGGNGSDGGPPSDGGYFYTHGREETKLNVTIVPRGTNKPGIGSVGGSGGAGGDGNPSGKPGKPGNRGSDGKPSTATGKSLRVIDLSGQAPTIKQDATC